MMHDEPEVGRYGVEEFYRKNYRQIDGSEIFLSLYNEKMGQEVLPALQLGIAILLKKPIYILVRKGDVVPEKLRKVADKIEYYETDEDMKNAINRLFGGQIDGDKT